MSSHKHSEEHHTPSKASVQAMHENDGHTTKAHSKDHVPGDELAHSHSHAAHLHEEAANAYLSDKENAQTKPEGNLRQGAHPTGLREPPMEVSRVGKQHRGQ